MVLMSPTSVNKVQHQTLALSVREVIAVRLMSPVALSTVSQTAPWTPAPQDTPVWWRLSSVVTGHPVPVSSPVLLLQVLLLQLLQSRAWKNFIDCVVTDNLTFTSMIDSVFYPSL
ncbi:hypothetical protein GBAR_LOCUS15908 [Geodia barretti]|uniref:Uncharacterized protein n=1 Tax=Geodia barretti TaxID=519541 RepID=A0AA35SD83_GEOBA|nr:hypothetical protein GBAR_LOCUS15908 [Geodia barretti]